MTGFSEARLDEVRQFLADVENRWPSGREVVRLKRECALLLAEVERLEAFLHSRLMHPDYEYTTTHGPRKNWMDADTPPEENAGWLWNKHKGDNGWERFDYHEEAYWMRPVGVHAEAPLEREGEMR